MATIPHYTCASCGHEWIPRAQTPPKICPRCKTDDWDKYEDAVVYFAQKGEGGPIKIGITTSIYSRMNLLRTHSEAPITILAVVSGGKTLESEIAKQFAHLALSGEWYSPDNTLLDYIESLEGKIQVEPRKRGRAPIHGAAIVFRLPLSEDKIFREKAKSEGLSPGEYARNIILLF